MKTRTLHLSVALLVLALVAFIDCDWIEDEVENSVDTSFDEDAEFEFGLTITDQSDDPEPQGLECGFTTIMDAIEEAGIDVDEVTIDDVDLSFVEARYRNATWEPDTTAVQSCGLYLYSSAGSALIVDMDVDYGSSDWTSVDLSAAALEVVNYLLSHLGEEFFYCALCTEDADTYSVEVYLNIGVVVKGEINT